MEKSTPAWKKYTNAVGGVADKYQVCVLDASGVLDAAWAPEGHEGRTQAGPKGHQLEAGARRAP